MGGGVCPQPLSTEALHACFVSLCHPPAMLSDECGSWALTHRVVYLYGAGRRIGGGGWGACDGPSVSIVADMVSTVDRQ